MLSLEKEGGKGDPVAAPWRRAVRTAAPRPAWWLQALWRGAAVAGCHAGGSGGAARERLAPRGGQVSVPEGVDAAAGGSRVWPAPALAAVLLLVGGWARDHQGPVTLLRILRT